MGPNWHSSKIYTGNNLGLIRRQNKRKLATVMKMILNNFKLQEVRILTAHFHRWVNMRRIQR